MTIVKAWYFVFGFIVGALVLFAANEMDLRHPNAKLIARVCGTL
jgi:hypothetical protein